MSDEIIPREQAENISLSFGYLYIVASTWESYRTLQNLIEHWTLYKQI
jgi:hypothetical protein